jgi:ferredoxin-NADP reductase
VQYTPGQFIELSIPHTNPDTRGTLRQFTLSSSPTDPLLSITTKLVPGGGGSSFKQALRSLQPGTKLHMNEPMGDFVLPKLIQTPLIFVAGGIGITPFHSILAWLHDVGEQRSIKLLYGVSNESEIIFQNTFEKAKQHATIVVDQPSDAWGGESGQLSAELIMGLEKPSDDTLVYLSGPEPMIETLHRNLRRAGMDERQLVTDLFSGYAHV